MPRMTATALREKLREASVVNGWGLAGHGAVFLSYRPSDRTNTPGWQVIRPGYKTDPEAHWQDNGWKTFDSDETGRGKAEALEDAKKWASERYGITEWVKTPFGEWMDKGVLETRLAELLKGGE